MYSEALLQAIGDGHHTGMYMGLHWIWWLVWVGIGAALVWALARMLATPADSGPPSEPEGDSADDILRARYARGEITEDELRERRRALRRSE